MAQRGKITTNFNIGAEQAEADPLLEAAFYESSVYAATADRTDRHCFIIGRTGSGKSAILTRLEETEGDHVIRIDPEDLSLPYILDLGVIRYLSDLNVHMDPLFIALWKHIFLVELLRHRYQVDSPEKKHNVFTTLMERVRRDPSKQAALEYLDEFGESFWCETDVRVREITTKFERRIGLTTQGQATLPGIPADASAGASAGTITSASSRSEEAERYQRIVNETQLPRLNKMIAVLDDEVLDSPYNFTYIVIDDLDKDWVDDQLANDLIRCLFRAALDLLKVRNLKIIVALRTNIFEHLNFGARTGGQEEKFRSLAVHMRWLPVELRGLADHRARVAAENAGLGDVSGIRDLLPPKTKKRGDPFEYLLDRTLMRPRDVIAFVNECLRDAAGKNRLAWSDIAEAELRYSKNRLLALRDEWKPTFPGIDQVFDVFSGSPVIMEPEDLSDRLNEAALLPARDDFPGVRWMTQLSEPIWSGIGASDWVELYRLLIQLLFDIGFLGLRGPDGKIRYSYDSPQHADSSSHLAETRAFTVHPAFRAALDIT